MGKKCPDCGANIMEFDYIANYTEMVYGSSWGTYTIDGGHNQSDSEADNYDNFEESDYGYNCPDCGNDVGCPEDLEDYDEDCVEPLDEEEKSSAKLKELFNEL